MKTSLPFIIAAALLASGCEKKEESAPPSVVRTPETGNQTRRPVIPAPAPEQSSPAAPATPATGEELEAFLTDLEKLAQEVAQLPQTGAPPAKVEELQQSHTALTRRRTALMNGMNEEQKREFLRKVAPSAKIISPTLMRLRLANSLEKAKNAMPRQPGTRQPDPALGDLIPGSNAPPPPSPPAPPPP